MKDAISKYGSKRQSGIDPATKFVCRYATQCGRARSFPNSPPFQQSGMLPTNVASVSRQAPYLGGDAHCCTLPWDGQGVRPS